MGTIVKGMKALTSKIKRIEKNVKKYVSVPAMKAAGKETARVIKSRMSSRYKDARKSIGWKMRKASENPKNVISAKAGAGVGFRGKRKASFLKSQAKRRGRKSKVTLLKGGGFRFHGTAARKGAGISPQNIHWWFMGTTQRRQTTTGRRTGRLPVMESPVKQLAATGKSEIFRVQVRAAVVGIKKLARS